jgi:hypothetical protein
MPADGNGKQVQCAACAQNSLRPLPSRLWVTPSLSVTESHRVNPALNRTRGLSPPVRNLPVKPEPPCPEDNQSYIYTNIYWGILLPEPTRQRKHKRFNIFLLCNASWAAESNHPICTKGDGTICGTEPRTW